MALPQIGATDYANKGIRIQTNPMQMAAATAQRIFDELTLDVVIPKFNAAMTAQDTINADVENRTTTLETNIDTKANTTDVLAKTNATSLSSA